jgi:2-dehydro-3-deoxyphosphogluconate aldolase / (4S)-4-hydroxy-2-oxoglutarate aldolase
LLTGLRRQPVLAVLRPGDENQARHQLDALLAVGLVHVELAVQASQAWVAMATQLVHHYPGLKLGAASVCSGPQLDAAMAAGLGYAVSPILSQGLLAQASAAAFPLVPGVLSPTEVYQAALWGAQLVKLFPAQPLGPRYWTSLRGPLGTLPFCIAAGGLDIVDVEPWLGAGVDAVALGSRLFCSGAGEQAMLSPELAPLLARFP